MKFRYLFLLILIICCSFQMYADRAVLEDFTDVGTWRVRAHCGATPGTFFAVSHCLSGISCRQRPDAYAGAVEFDFSGPAPYYLGFERYKIYKKASVFTDAITFSADRLNIDVKISFIIEDANRKRFRTSSIKLVEKGWKDYNLPINESTVKNFKKLEQPVRLKRIVVNFANPGKGKFLIDDIAFSGDISKKQRLTITPVYNGIAVLPSQAATREYLIRNGGKKKINVTVSLNVFNFNDEKVFSKSMQIPVSPFGMQAVKFKIGKLAPGAYYTKASVNYKRINNNFEGWFGVYIPNSKRLNFKPMYFGVQDTDTWNGTYENELHLTWLKALGIDIVRFGSSGGRFEPAEGVNGFADLDKQLKPLQKANILVCMSYCEGTPKWLQNPPYYYRRMPDKQDKLAKHMANIGNFLKKYPNIQYFEWWNEPDVGFLRDSFENYLKSLKTVYTSIKKVNPAIKVTTGGVTVKHPKEKKNFSRDMYQKGKGYYDIACFHAHGSPQGYEERNNMVEKWLQEKNIKVPLCNTETGERSAYNVQDTKQQAETLVKKLVFAKSRNTEFYIWFTLQDYWDMDNADDSFGLVTCDNQPKPAFVAYNNLIKQLANTKLASSIELDNRLISYHFKTKKGNDVFACWPKISGEKNLLFINSNAPVFFSDMFGKIKKYIPKSGKVRIANTSRPFYLTAPAGSIKPGLAIVKISSGQGGAPGELCQLSVTISNPFNKQTVFELTGKDIAEMVKVTVQPKQKLKIIIPVKTNRTTFGTFNTSIQVRVKPDGEKTQQLNIPIKINAAYTIVKQGKQPRVISINKRSCIHEMTYDPSIPQWRDANDLSCRAWATHNSKGIQFTFEVVDDKHVAKSQGGNIWRNDSIQLGLGTQDNKYTEITISASPDGSTVWSHYPSESAGKWNVPVSVKRKGQHTIYNVFIPFSKIGTKYSSGKMMRMAFLVNEDDGLGRVRWMEWFKGIGSSKDPSKFGWIILR